MTIEIVIGSDSSLENKNLQICKLILDECNISYEVVIDRVKMCRWSRGHCNPVNGFAVIFDQDSLAGLSYFDVVRWIEKSGLRPL